MKSFSTRVSFFYAAYFLVIGVYLPFFPVWLGARGLTPGDIALIVAIPMIMRVVFTPIMAVAAGRMGGLRRAIMVFAFLGAVPIALLDIVSGVWLIAGLVALSALFWNPVLPLAEALTMAGVNRGSLSYGRMRLWGSWSFIAANLGAGWLLSRYNPDWAIHIITVCYFICALSAVFLLEPDRDDKTPAAGAPATLKSAGALLRLAPLTLAIITASLAQASHGVLYAMGSLHWAALGYGGVTIGAFWALGVLAEILLFVFSRQAFLGFGAFGLLLLGGLAGVMRWGAFALDPGLVGFALLQALHGFTFGATHLGIVHMIGHAVPERQAATAQAISFTFGGLFLGLSAFAAGPLYEAFGGASYLAMGALSGVSAALALAGVLLFGKQLKDVRVTESPEPQPHKSGSGG
ncbi:MAG: MFS transporter [Pseudomonadota bacterium]